MTDRLVAKAHLSEGDRIAYDKAVDRYNVSRIVENDIREQAVAEGKAIGKAIGKAEGKAEGEAEGRLKERLEIARKLKEDSFHSGYCRELPDFQRKKLISCNGVHD